MAQNHDARQIIGDERLAYQPFSLKAVADLIELVGNLV